MKEQILNFRHHQEMAARLLTVFLAAGAVIAGSSAAGCDNGGGMSLTDYLSQVQQRECQLSIECCTTHELEERYDRPVEDVQRCADEPQDMSRVVDALYQPILDSGRVVFDADRAAACLAAYETMTCAQYAAPGGMYEGFCESPLVPQQDMGETCRNDMECLSDYCDGGSITTDGVCGTAPGEGEDCGSSCAEGYWCTFGTCEAMLDDGEACLLNQECLSGACFTPEGETDRVCGVMCDGQ